MKTKLLFTLMLITSICASAQFVNIPDANLKAALLDHGSGIVDTVGGISTGTIDTINDNEISISEAQNYTGLISLFGQNISDFTGLEAFINIRGFKLENNPIATVNLSSNIDLEVLSCNNNAFTSLDISNNTALFFVSCNDNMLSSLDVTNNTALVTLSILDNALSSTDVSSNLALRTLSIRGNALGNLNTSNNANLRILDCSSNSISALNLTNNSLLQRVILGNNQLISLDLANGNNSNINFFNATNNPNLSCIQIDSGFTPPTSTWFKDASANYSDNCPPCIVNIPDANFKTALLAHGSTITGTNVGIIDTNGDGEIQCAEASAYSGRLILNNNNAAIITDMTGLESFVNLTYLLLDGQSLSTIDVSNNVALTYLSVGGNQLTAIDISNNSSLIELLLRDNLITNIDVTQNSNLERFDIGENSLSTLDVSQNSVLTFLDIGTNNLSAIDLSANASLDSFNTEDNPNLTAIDFSNNGNLFELQILNSALTSIDLTSNGGLGEVSIRNNSSLTSLNVANGSNISITSANFTLNSNLNCIQIDSGFTPPSTWNKDASASYSDNCPPCIVNIPDANFKAALLAHGSTITGTNISTIDTNGNLEIECTEAQSYTGRINVGSQNVSNLDGLESFINITSLFAGSNMISTIDVSNNTKLTSLGVNSNTISSLDLSNNSELTVLSVSANALTNLDCSNNPDLLFLYGEQNSLNSVNVSNSSGLRGIFLQMNALTAIDVSNNTNLVDLDLGNNSLGSLDVSSNLNLESLICNFNSITSLDVSGNTVLEFLTCNRNLLTNLDISNGNNINFRQFNASNNSGLSCIQIDSGFTPPTNGSWDKDATASYSTNCPTLSIDDFEAVSFKLYPNPTTSILNIETIEDIEYIDIFSVLGKKIKTIDNSATINVSNLKTGIYFLNVHTKNGNSETLRFVKQ